MERLFFSLILIIGGLLLGYTLRSLTTLGYIRLPLAIDDLRKILQKIGLLFFMPVSFLAAVWMVDFSDLKIVMVPLFGLLALLSGGVYGYLGARLMGVPARQAGVLFCCSSFTNIGAIGALVCYMFLGEPGFALVALYKMFEEIYYYTIGFPIVRYISATDEVENNGFGAKLLAVLTDPFVTTILTAFFAGMTLNLTGIERPQVFEKINAVFIPAGTFILIVSIGLGMRLSRLAAHLPKGLFVAVIKAILVPAGTTALAMTAGLGALEGGLVTKVIFILSSMPVAFNALVAASIYDLDLDLANSCWLISTIGLCVVMPWLHWAMRFF